jgi:putative nucleotidyltransferase-like protein
MSPENPLPPAIQAMGRTMGADRVTAEVVTAFRAKGIESILLKGPAIAQWLYDEGALRPYADCDLLVPPDDFVRGETVLADLGFEREGLDTIPGDWPKHARTWYRDDGGNVDLHRTFVGVGVTDAQLWEQFSSRTEIMKVAGTDVRVLSKPGRALVLTLHAAKDGARVGKARHDLGHALERVPLEVWREAAALAVRLEASPAFAAGLRLVLDGRRLADELGLPSEIPMETALRQRGGAPPFAVGIEWLATTPGVMRKVALIGRKLLPPSAFMRSWSPLARRGRLGLALAYLWRPFWVLWRLGPALWTWFRARTQVRRSRTRRRDPI